MADVNISNDTLLTDESIDKVEEYFKSKDILRTLRSDLKDLQAQSPEYQELQKLLSKVKELRDKINEDENVRQLKEKISTTKERQDLLKELIRIDLLEHGQEEVKRNGRKLKIVNNLRELKDEAEKPKKKFFRN